MTNPRFTEERIDELLQVSNALSEGEDVSYDDARDLALYAMDELNRVSNAYQHRLSELALSAMNACSYPE